MAEGKPCDCEIVPTRDSCIFHFRVRLSSLGDPLVGQSAVYASNLGTECGCVATYLPRHSSPQIQVALKVRPDPVPEGAARLSTHMVLLDKTGSPAPSMGTGRILGRVPGLREAGYVLKAEVDDVNANCVVDDYFVVLCSVDIGWTPPASSTENELPDLGHDLATMSDKREFTDVSFEVCGESFSAHRLVLAARSPVFRAQLYGPMAESKMTSMTIQDMEASTFRSMLHYMYHGSLPNNAGKAAVSSAVAEYQHLLVAADRYGVEGLKKICEDKLSMNGITVDSVVSLLELAEDHVCPKLKARCFDFLADGDNFKVVATSGEYLHLMQSFPNLLVEARNRFKTPREKPTIMDPGSRKKTRGC